MLDIYEINKVLAITWAEDVDTCLKTIKRLSAKPLCIVNCINYGHPNHNFNIELLRLDIKKMNIACKQNNIPIVGGNVSLYNTTNDVSIRPTLVILMIGII